MIQPLTQFHTDMLVACYNCANERFPAHRRPNATAEDFLTILASDTAFGWFDNGQLAGFISYGVQKDAVRISALYVDAGYGRQGIAAQLLDLAVGAATESGAGVCVADCLKEADWALSFYCKHGFTLSEIDGEPWAVRVCKVMERGTTI